VAAGAGTLGRVQPSLAAADRAGDGAFAFAFGTFDRCCFFRHYFSIFILPWFESMDLYLCILTPWGRVLTPGIETADG
jgi:hypothetical protein